MSSTFAEPDAGPRPRSCGGRSRRRGARSAPRGAWRPSTATVQGYLLVSDGPLSEPEVRRALGMSHRAASLALAQCEEWGLVERANAPRRSGQRGPAATAWLVVDDHWEWFRRVAAARKQRETDPCCRSSRAASTEARRSGRGRRPGAGPPGRAARRAARVRPALRPWRRDLRAGRCAGHRGRLRGAGRHSTTRRWTASGAWWASSGPDDMVRALEALATLSPAAARRLIGLADQPVLQKLDRDSLRPARATRRSRRPRRPTRPR